MAVPSDERDLELLFTKPFLWLGLGVQILLLLFSLVNILFNVPNHLGPCFRLLVLFPSFYHLYYTTRSYFAPLYLDHSDIRNYHVRIYLHPIKQSF